MKQTGFDMTTILYQKLTGSALDSAITGGVYRTKRPAWSMLEDVVINALPVTTAQLQQGVANVNIYVPDAAIQINGKPDMVPDEARMKLLTDTALTVLTDAYTQRYSFSVVSTTTFAEPDTKHHFVNLRIEFLFFQTS